MANEKTILQDNEITILKEGIGSGVISCGNVLELLSTGKVQRNSNDGVNVQMYVASEQYGLGKGYSDDYADGDRVEYNILKRGDRALMKTVGTFAIGTYGEVDAVGSIIPLNTGAPVALALEAASGTQNTKMEIM